MDDMTSRLQRRTVRTICFLAAAGTVAAAGLGVMAASQDSNLSVVARVGERVIVVADVWDRLKVRRAQDFAAKRLDSFTADGRKRVLAELLDARLFSTAAREQGFDRRPDIARRLANAQDEALAQLLIADMVDRQSTSEEDLKKFFDAHADQFRGPDQVRARQIVVKTRPEAEALLGELRSGADFASLARAHNIDSSRDKDGDLGLVKRGVMVPQFEQALFALKVGELSGIVQTSFGFHIVRAEEIQRGAVPAFETVKDRVRKALIDQTVADARERLRQRYPVRVDEDALAAVDK